MPRTLATPADGLGSLGGGSGVPGPLLLPLFDGVRAHEKALSSALVVSDVRGGKPAATEAACAACTSGLGAWGAQLVHACWQAGRGASGSARASRMRRPTRRRSAAPLPRGHPIVPRVDTMPEAAPPRVASWLACCLAGQHGGLGCGIVRRVWQSSPTHGAAHGPLLCLCVELCGGYGRAARHTGRRTDLCSACVWHCVEAMAEQPGTWGGGQTALP
eukprot:359910-Chlamydomonas_euryale.AAC.1